MLETLYNDELVVTVNTLGAELWSLKRRADGREFLWQGEKSVWPRRAPLLFPITGALKDGRIRIGEREYEIPMHGFARDYEHEVISEGAGQLTLRFPGNAETAQRYPYHYVLEITYRLCGSLLEETACVRNTGEETMYFSLGFHTGFFCPPGRAGRAGDCVIRFASREHCMRLETGPDGLLSGKRKPFFQGGDTILLNAPVFPGTLLLDHPKSLFVELADPAGGDYVRVFMKDFPYLLFWTNQKAVPFLCIEPWYGLPDPECGEAEIGEKPGILSLAPGRTFSCTQAIGISLRER